jgi:oligopeptide transport system substrate-binding protein
MIKRVFLFLFLALLSPLLLFPQADTASPELVLAYAPKDVTLDPLHVYTTMESELGTALYEGLLTYHPVTLEPIPGVASSWEEEEGGRLYRFTLREEASYSNGDPVRAQDFLAAWLRILDPDNRAEYSFLFDVIKGARAYRLGEEGEELGIRVVSDTVLEVELEKPARHFLKILCHLSFVPLHPGYQDKQDWGRAPVLITNGPFYLASRDENGLVLRKNKLYWDAGTVELEGIRVRLEEDPEKISALFNAGEVHWASSWDTATLTDRSHIVFNPLFATSYFYFVCADPPWRDARVRRALTLLLPLEELRSRERLFPTSRLIPPIPVYPDTSSLDTADPEEALALLAEAGYPEGKGLPAPLFKVARDSESEELAALMAAAWREKLGLESRIVSFDYDRYLEEVKKADYTLGFVTWIGDYADPLTFLQMWTRSSNLNDARYDNPKFDRLIDSSFSQLGAERYQTMSQAEALLLTEAAVLPISHAPAFNLIDLDRLEGWFPTMLNIHPFKYVRFRTPRLPPGLAGDPGRPAPPS